MYIVQVFRQNEAILSEQFCTLHLQYQDDSETQEVKKSFYLSFNFLAEKF